MDLKPVNQSELEIGTGKCLKKMQTLLTLLSLSITHYVKNYTQSLTGMFYDRWLSVCALI